MLFATALASAGIPLVSDIIQRLAHKFIGPRDAAELGRVESEKLTALGQLDNFPLEIGNSSLTKGQVNAILMVYVIKNLLRPVLSISVLAIFVTMTLYFGIGLTALIPFIMELMTAVIFFVFGERLTFKLRK